MHKTLITGGAGFIGSHLAELLLKQGHEVFIIDDLSTGSLDNINILKKYPRFSYEISSIHNEELVDSAVKDSDHIYHLAASVGVKRIVNELVNSIENTIHGSEVVLAAAAAHHKQILLTSTSEVYGRQNDEPYQETDDLRMGETIKTRWSYACSKALDEYLAFAYYHESNLPVIITRLFNTVGERQSPAYGMVLPIFVSQALSNQPVTIYGDGNQSRCFCHVSDVVSSLHKLMSIKSSIGSVFNVGSDQEITINELADKVINLLGSRSQKKYVPYEQIYKVGFDDIRRRVPNISKIKKHINYQPKKNLDEVILGVAKSISKQSEPLAVKQ